MPSASTVIGAEARAAAPAASASVVRVELAWFAASGCTVAGLTSLWLTNGVDPADVALYLAYIGGLVVVPGVLFAALLDRRPLGLAHVCVGIPLGFVQLMLAFICLAALGLRGLAPWEPVAAGLLAAIVLLRRRQVLAVRFSRRLRWDAILVTAIALASAGLTATRWFDTHPLPTQIGHSGATYYDDMPWHIANAAELKTYWPPTDLHFLGQPFKYYIGDYLQAAGTSIATDIQPESLMLRLDPLLHVVVFTFLLFWVGRTLGRRGRAGVVAAFLALLVGDVSSVRRSGDSLFVNLFVHDMFLSPTFLIGLLFFTALLGVLVEWLRHPVSLRSGRFVALVLLAVGAGLSKSTTLPLLVAAGIGLALYESMVRKRTARPGVVLALLGVAVYLVLSPLVRWQGQEGSLSVDPFILARRSGADAWITTTFIGQLPHNTLIIPWLVVLGSAPALLIAAGGYLVLRRGRLSTEEAGVVLIAAAGMAIVLLLVGAGGGQLYFWYYGYAAFALVAALGVDALLDVWRSWPRTVALASISACVVIGVASIVLQSGPEARRIISWVVPGVPGPFHSGVPSPPALTPELVRGLVWLRDHSPPKSVVAVNNVSNLDRPGDARYFYYSALSQRQMLVEGTGFTAALMPPVQAEAQAELNERLALVDRIYAHGSKAAIEDARRQYGVSYLLVDERVAPAGHSWPNAAARLVFADRHVRIYQVADAVGVG